MGRPEPRKNFLKEKIPQYRQDIVLFAKEVLRFTPDEWQERVFMDVVNSNRISVKSGQGVGKTGCEAIILLWFLCCFPFPRIVATAPTKQQLHDVLWSEVAKWQSKSPALSAILKWTKTYIYMVGYEKRWFAVARTATKPENMQGFHEDNMLFLVDEASGVADPIMEAIQGTLSGVNNKLVLCGNPTKTSGVFYESHTSDRALWKCHTVNSLNSPRTSKENIEALKRKYGENSNVYRVRVLGEFPMQEDDVFIPLAWVENSIMSESAHSSPVDTIDIGCDVARFGDAKTVIGYKVDDKAYIYKKFNGQDLMYTAKVIALLGQQLRDKHKFTDEIVVKVDDGGLGGGVTDKLNELKRDYPDLYGWLKVIPVHFGQPIKHKYYHDTTTWMMAVIRELIAPEDDDGNPQQVQLILPNDNDLVAQLSCRKYGYQANGKQKVESKREMKERGLSSPDEADCMLLVCLPIDRKKPKKSR